MKKSALILISSVICVLPMFAETNALIEVKLFKDWVIKGEINFGNLAIKNTGTDSIRLAKTPFNFEIGQLVTRALPRDAHEDLRQENDYKEMVVVEQADFFNLLPGETHVYDGRKFYIGNTAHFKEEIHFTVSVYLGQGAWLDSEPLMYHGVVPDSEEHLETIHNNKLAREGKNLDNTWNLVAVTYKNERWLYKKSIPKTGLFSGKYCYPICPLSLTNKIRVEAHDDENLFKIWDGDKSMIFHFTKNILIEGPDEHDVLGKWTRERKQKAEADNAEVRRKKALEAGN